MRIKPSFKRRKIVSPKTKTNSVNEGKSPADDVKTPVVEKMKTKKQQWDRNFSLTRITENPSIGEQDYSIEKKRASGHSILIVLNNKSIDTPGEDAKDIEALAHCKIPYITNSSPSIIPEENTVNSSKKIIKIKIMDKNENLDASYSLSDSDELQVSDDEMEQIEEIANKNATNEDKFHPYDRCERPPSHLFVEDKAKDENFFLLDELEE